MELLKNKKVREDISIDIFALEGESLPTGNQFSHIDGKYSKKYFYLKQSAFFAVD